MEHGVRKRMQPAFKMPHKAGSRLPSADHQLLAGILSAPVEFVGHKLFERSRRAERKLFGAETLSPGASEFPPAALHADQSIRFLRLNYARYRIFRIVSLCRGNRLSLPGARTLLAWRRRESEAREAIVRENIGLVMSMARDHRPGNLDWDEAVSEGNLALFNSVNGFDCSRCRFATYACRAILKAFARAASKTGRRRTMFPTEYDAALEKPDDPRPAEREADCAHEIAAIIRENRAELSDREMEVICARFYEDGRVTLEDVGNRLGVTKERVRQIQERAMGKIKAVLEPTL